MQVTTPRFAVAAAALMSALVAVDPGYADDPVFEEAISRAYTVENRSSVGVFDEAISASLSADNLTSVGVFDEALSASISADNLTSIGVFDEALGRAVSADNRTYIGVFDESISRSATSCNYAEVPDTDDDGVNDCEDNCPDEINPRQGDLDGDGIGNVCDEHIGDMDCSGSVDFDDIDGFVTALISRESYVEVYDDCNWFNGDIDRNCSVDFDDIDYFVVCLINSGCE